MADNDADVQGDLKEELSPLSLSLDQVSMFLAAVDEGSFSAAGRKLNRVQSAISYGIATLEESLGIMLFDRSSRSPSLTKEGEAMVIEARALLDQARAMHRRAAAMQTGLEPEVSLVVDATFPVSELVSLAKWFDATFQGTRLRLQTETLGGVAHRLASGECQLGVTGPEGWNRHQFSAQPARRVQLLPVAAPTHVLAKQMDAGRSGIEEGDLTMETQIVLSDRSEGTAGKDFGVLSRRTWRVADLWTKHALLRAGLGWGTMPEHMVADDLQRGELKLLRVLPLEGQELCLTLFAITARDAKPLGRAGQALFERLTQG